MKSWGRCGSGRADGGRVRQSTCLLGLVPVQVYIDLVLKFKNIDVLKCVRRSVIQVWLSHHADGPQLPSLELWHSLNQTHTHTHSDTQRHTHTHTHTHTDTHTKKERRTNTCTRAHTNTHTYTHTGLQLVLQPFMSIDWGWLGLFSFFLVVCWLAAGNKVKEATEEARYLWWSVASRQRGGDRETSSLPSISTSLLSISSLALWLAWADGEQRCRARWLTRPIWIQSHTIQMDGFIFGTQHKLKQGKAVDTGRTRLCVALMRRSELLSVWDWCPGFHYTGNCKSATEKPASTNDNVKSGVKVAWPEMANEWIPFCICSPSLETPLFWGIWG